jgi:hypothetical protein
MRPAAPGPDHRAARAATNPGFPLSVYGTELRGVARALDPLPGGDLATDVRAVFSWSYRALSDPAARMFRLLGLHPGPDISLAAAASLAAAITWVPETSRHSPGGGWTAPAQLATLSGQSGKIAATPAGSFVVEDGGNAVTSPPGQGFGTPVNLAPSGNIMQLTAAAGHALAILAVGGSLSAATEPVT